MKTAVEFYREELNALVSLRETKFKTEQEIFEKALEMEKEQMRSDFWHHRRITGYEILKDKVETFKQQEQ
jgi:hypothetical protein